MLPHKRIFSIVCLVLFIGSSSVTGDNDNDITPPQYHTTYEELPSPDWFLPVRVFMSIFASATVAGDIWTSIRVNNVTKVDIEKIVTPMIGMVTLAVIGILFAVVTIVGGITLCCCRLCDNCGGNYQQSLKSSQNGYCRYVLSSILLFSLLVSLVGLIFMYISLPLKKNFISDYKDSLDNNFADLEVYVNYSRQEIDFLIKKDIVDTLEGESHKLQSFGTDIGAQIYNDTRKSSNVDDVLKGLASTADAVGQIQTLLNEINNEIIDVDEQVNTLNLKLTEIGAHLDGFVDNCTTSCNSVPCRKACDNIKKSQSNFNLTVPNLDLQEEIDKLNNIVEKNLTNSIETYSMNFHNIPALVDSAAKPSMLKISDKLNDTKNFVINSINDMDTFFNQLSESLSTFHDSFHIVEDNVDIADNILFGVSLAISIILSLIWILFTCGLFGGTFVFDRDVPPTERSGPSDCFGLLLLIATCLTFCVSGILWLLTAVVSIPGSGLYFVVCQTLFDEKFAVLDSLTRTNIIPVPSEYSFNISTMLHSCQSNYSAFYSFGLIDSVDINDTLYNDLDNVTYVWNTSDVGNWDLGLDKSDMNVTLADFKSAMEFNFTSYMNNVSDVMSVQLKNKTDHFSDIKLQLQAFTDEPLNSQAQQLSTEIDYFNNLTLTLNATVENLNFAIQNWTNVTTDLSAQVSLCTSSLPLISRVIGNSAVNAVTRYSVDFVSDLYTAIKDLVDTLYYEVSNCWPIWVIFQSLRVKSCRNTLDPLNSFWFNLGIVLFFFLVAVIPALKLMKYFRTMKLNSRGKNDFLHRPPIPRRPEKIHQTTNNYFEDFDLIDAVPIKTVDENVKYMKNNRIQPIIDAFDHQQFPNPMTSQQPPPDLLRGNAFMGSHEPNIMEPAIRLSPEDLEIYKRIPRVTTRTPPSSVVGYESLHSKPHFYSKVAPIPPPRAKPVFIPTVPHDKDQRYKN